MLRNALRRPSQLTKDFEARLRSPLRSLTSINGRLLKSTRPNLRNLSPEAAMTVANLVGVERRAACSGQRANDCALLATK